MKELILGGYIPSLSGNSQTKEVYSKNFKKNALSIGTISISNTKKKDGSNSFKLINTTL